MTVPPFPLPPLKVTSSRTSGMPKSTGFYASAFKQQEALPPSNPRPQQHTLRPLLAPLAAPAALPPLEWGPLPHYATPQGQTVLPPLPPLRPTSNWTSTVSSPVLTRSLQTCGSSTTMPAGPQPSLRPPIHPCPLCLAPPRSWSRSLTRCCLLTLTASGAERHGSASLVLFIHPCPPPPPSFMRGYCSKPWQAERG